MAELILVNGPLLSRLWACDPSRIDVTSFPYIGDTYAHDCMCLQTVTLQLLLCRIAEYTRADVTFIWLNKCTVFAPNKHFHKNLFAYLRINIKVLFTFMLIYTYTAYVSDSRRMYNHLHVQAPIIILQSYMRRHTSFFLPNVIFISPPLFYHFFFHVKCYFYIPPPFYHFFFHVKWYFYISPTLLSLLFSLFFILFCLFVLLHSSDMLHEEESWYKYRFYRTLLDETYHERVGGESLFLPALFLTAGPLSWVQKECYLWSETYSSFPLLWYDFFLSLSLYLFLCYLLLKNVSFLLIFFFFLFRLAFFCQSGFTCIRAVV